MNTMAAFVKAIANHDRELMVFDWDKAARIIRERQPDTAWAGLRDDWEYTGGMIFNNGQIVNDDYTYLASTWAVPELDLDFANGSQEVVECYRMQSEVPKWNAGTKWPKSALAILVGEDEKNGKTG